MALKNERRLDSNEVIFFKRQLEYVKARAYEVENKDLKAFSLIPISTEAPMGATEITWREYDMYGMAAVIADYAHDFPRVDVFGVEHTVKPKDLGVSYGYSIQEIRRAAMAGVDLETRRARAARRAIDEKINKIALIGDAANNLNGLINYPGILAYVVPNGDGGTTEWSTKTPDEILADLNGIMLTVATNTDEKERPRVICMPLAQLSLIRNTRIGTTSDKTIAQFFLENNPGVRFESLAELAGAGADGADRFLAFDPSEDKLTLEIPNAFEQLEEEHSGAEYKIPCIATTAGVVVYRPYSICFGDGI